MNNNFNNQEDKEKNNQENLNNDNINNNEPEKITEVEKKSALPVFAFGISFALFSMILRLNTVSKFIGILVLSFIVYQIVKSKFPAKKVEIYKEKEDLNAKKAEQIKKDNAKTNKKEVKEEIKNPELKALNERIDIYGIELKLLDDAIDDDFISNEIKEIGVTLKKIQVEIKDETKKNLVRRIEQLNEFFDYYMPTTIKILNSYRKIESQGLTGDNAKETKTRVEKTLPFVRKAFAKELDNMFTDEMLDITTDIDVLETMLSKDGVIDENNINKF